MSLEYIQHLHLEILNNPQVIKKSFPILYACVSVQAVDSIDVQKLDPLKMDWGNAIVTIKEGILQFYLQVYMESHGNPSNTDLLLRF